MRYTQYRGLTQVTNWVKLKFVAMNLKKLAKWKAGTSLFRFRYSPFWLKYSQNPVCATAQTGFLERATADGFCHPLFL